MGSLTYRGQRRTFATDGQPGKATLEMYQVRAMTIVSINRVCIDGIAAIVVPPGDVSGESDDYCVHKS